MAVILLSYVEYKLLNITSLKIDNYTFCMGESNLW
jgi:hypothetical protein